MITMMGVNFHFSEQSTGEVIEEIKNLKVKKLFNGHKFKRLRLQ
jgi:hypothetical protein